MSQVNEFGTIFSQTNTLQIINTTSSTSSSTGGIVSMGGIAINNTTNATNATNGGSLTVGGGASVMLDMFIGGNVTIGGTLSLASGATSNILTSPTLTLINGTNVSSVTVGKSVLNTIGTQHFYFVIFQISVTSAGVSSNFSFTAPSAASNFTGPNDTLVNATGYTVNNSTIFSIVTQPTPSSKTIVVKFSSSDTSIHYISLSMCYL
jgi:hypothetical protein